MFYNLTNLPIEKEGDFNVVMDVSDNMTDVVYHTYYEPQCHNTEQHDCNDGANCYYDNNNCEFIDELHCEVSSVLDENGKMIHDWAFRRPVEEVKARVLEIIEFYKVKKENLQ